MRAWGGAAGIRGRRTPSFDSETGMGLELGAWKAGGGAELIVLLFNTKQMIGFGAII